MHKKTFLWVAVIMLLFAGVHAEAAGKRTDDLMVKISNDNEMGICPGCVTPAGKANLYGVSQTAEWMVAMPKAAYDPEKNYCDAKPDPTKIFFKPRPESSDGIVPLFTGYMKTPGELGSYVNTMEYIACVTSEDEEKAEGDYMILAEAPEEVVPGEEFTIKFTLNPKYKKYADKVNYIHSNLLENYIKFISASGKILLEEEFLQNVWTDYKPIQVYRYPSDIESELRANAMMDKYGIDRQERWIQFDSEKGLELKVRASTEKELENHRDFSMESSKTSFADMAGMFDEIKTLAPTQEKMKDREPCRVAPDDKVQGMPWDYYWFQYGAKLFSTIQGSPVSAQESTTLALPNRRVQNVCIAIVHEKKNVDFKISGTASDKFGRPLRQIAVSFWWNDNGSSDYKTYKKLANGVADEGGKYDLRFKKPENKNEKGKGFIKIDLKDNDGVFRMINWNRGMDTTNAGEALDRYHAGYASWYFFGKDGLNSFLELKKEDEEMKLDVKFEDRGFLAGIAAPPGAFDGAQAESDAVVYANFMIAADFYKQLGFNFPARFSVFTFVSTGGVSYFGSPAYRLFMDSSHTTDIPGPLIAVGIDHSNLAANINAYKYRANVEWHEFTHYVNWRLNPKIYSYACLDEISRQPSKNHLGFLNGCTFDSYSEGLAEFMGQVIYNKTLSQTKAYDSKYIDPMFGLGAMMALEENWPVNRIGRDGVDTEQSEEVSLAGVLWDLYDGKNAADSDDIEMDIQSIWKTVSTPDIWPAYYDNAGQWIYHLGQNENRIPVYFSDLYDALLKGYPPEKPAIDKIFISKQIFWDKIGKVNNYDPGDVIGVASPIAEHTIRPPLLNWIKNLTDRPRQFRQDRQFSTSSVVIVSSLKEMLPYDAVIKVSVNPPHEYLGFEFPIVITQENEPVYIPLPPSPSYESTYTLIAKKKDYAEKQIFAVNSEEFYKELPPEKTAEPYTAELPVLQPLPPAPSEKSGQDGNATYIIAVMTVLAIAGGGLFFFFKMRKKK